MVNDFASPLEPAAARPAEHTTGSTVSTVYRARSCSAPHCPLDGSNGFLGRTMPYDAVSPVTRNEPVASHAWLVTSRVVVPVVTRCDDCMYSAKPPKDL